MDQERKVREIRRRAEVRDLKHGIRTIASASVVLAVMLVAVIAFSAGAPSGEPPDTLYGSMLGGSDIGGYVLTAVIAFTAGIVATAICLKLRKSLTEKTEDGEAEKRGHEGG